MADRKNFVFNHGMQNIEVGPESRVYLYFGEGQQKYNNASIERMDKVMSRNGDESKGPITTSFDTGVIRLLGGLAIPDDRFAEDDILAIASLMMNEVGYSVEVVIAEKPSSFIVEVYNHQHEAKESIVKKLTEDLYASATFPEQWVTADET